MHFLGRLICVTLAYAVVLTLIVFVPRQPNPGQLFQGFVSVLMLSFIFAFIFCIALQLVEIFLPKPLWVAMTVTNLLLFAVLFGVVYGGPLRGVATDPSVPPPTWMIVRTRSSMIWEGLGILVVCFASHGLGLGLHEALKRWRR